MPGADESNNPGSANTDLEFAKDQTRLTEAAACLDAMKHRTEQVQEVAARAVRDENTTDARVVEARLNRRRADLDVGAGPLCFGRIDEEPMGPSQRGDQWYVGRRHIEDEKGAPVIVDWRAPVSAPFYRATAVDPCGLERRRRFSADGPNLEAVFDEDLTDPDEGGVGGLPDPLIAELDRSRTGQMRDIVATIASEQDVIIRAPLDELLIVQGGPGTGKTAVGLHRAAFLLFQHRDFLADNKVLVVGPNPVFLRYVAEVLPSLGERSVIQTTLKGLLAARHRVRTVEDDVTAELKGDPRLALVVHNLMRSKVRPLDGVLELRSGVNVLRFSSEDVEELQDRVLTRSLPMNAARDVFRSVLLQEAWQRYLKRSGADPGIQPAFVAAIRNDASFKKDFDRMWPTQSPPVVVRELLGSARRRERASQGLLDTEEQALLHRKSTARTADEPWSAADLPLLDEATHIASGVPATYGHVVVDEAQDHTAMALRMLGRRAIGQSMTILGDLAQATAPGAMTSWHDAVGHLTSGVDVRHEELTVGYRVPAEILDVANTLLRVAAPDVTPAVSVRPGGIPPQWFEFAAERAAADDRPMAMAAAVLSALSSMPQSVRSRAVVAAAEDLDELEHALRVGGHAVERVGGPAAGSSLPGSAAVALVDPDGAKGLEFDAVVVVDPDAVADHRHGLRRLYVAMTRAVQYLAIVRRLDVEKPLIDQARVLDDVFLAGGNVAAHEDLEHL